jgi:transcriptional regulator with XRE-family HTH domain
MKRNDTTEAPPRVEGPGGKLRNWRTAAKLTLEAAAIRLGLTSASTVSEYERGSRSPSFASAKAIQKLTRGAVRVEEWGFDPKTGRRGK